MKALCVMSKEVLKVIWNRWLIKIKIVLDPKYCPEAHRSESVLLMVTH